jgi:hypothetical protein
MAVGKESRTLENVLMSAVLWALAVAEMRDHLVVATVVVVVVVVAF